VATALAESLDKPFPWQSGSSSAIPNLAWNFGRLCPAYQGSTI